MYDLIFILIDWIKNDRSENKDHMQLHVGHFMVMFYQYMYVIFYLYTFADINVLHYFYTVWRLFFICKNSVLRFWQCNVQYMYIQLNKWSTVFNLSQILISQNSERRMLKQWAADTKEELSLANKEFTAVSKL